VRKYIRAGTAEDEPGIGRLGGGPVGSGRLGGGPVGSGRLGGGPVGSGMSSGTVNINYMLVYRRCFLCINKPGSAPGGNGCSSLCVAVKREGLGMQWGGK
jgi:hypothetical protein